MPEPFQTTTYRRHALEAPYELHYAVDRLAAPWREAETILLVHGLAESGAAWLGWLPMLGRDYELLRPDLRGFGQSTPMPRDFVWSLDLLAADLAGLINTQGRGPVHVVGAKIGATILVRLAARHPELVRSLVVIGLPVKGSSKRPGLDPERHGVRTWARSSMEERLGDVPPAMLEWWSDLMGQTAPSTLLGFSHAVGEFDVGDDLARLSGRVLAIGTDSARHSAADMRAWSARIKTCETVVIPGEGYHAAAVYPEACARAVLKFLGSK